MKQSKSFTTDVLVIGTGLTGLRAANEAAREGANVILVGKGVNASVDIMGFNIAIRPGDSEDIYYEDIIRSGNYINNKKAARLLAEESTKQVAYLESIGFVFDKNDDGTYHAQHPIGSTIPRLIHQKAVSGIEAIKLITADNEKRGVRVQYPVMITELLKNEDNVIGAVGMDLKDGTFVSYLCKSVILATGGCGKIHPISTYPKGIVGDGYAMGHRAGAELIDMEFLQYEPCCLVYPEEVIGQPLPTTMVMAGAELYNSKGETFTQNYGLHRGNMQKGELSRAIAAEIEAGRGTKNGGIYYDLTMLPHDYIAVDHCIFYEPALAAGLDITKVKAEVAPAAHTCLGGIKINERCESTVNGLYAAGEVAGGVHGANRIGGSAGAETLSFGAVAGRFAARNALKSQNNVSADITATYIDNHKQDHFAKYNRSGTLTSDNLYEKLSMLMHKKVGIIRDNEGLLSAASQLKKIKSELHNVAVNDLNNLIMLYQLENMITTSKMQIKSSLIRKESRGVYFRSDYPEKNDQEWLKNITIKQEEGEMTAYIKDCE